MSGVDYDEVVSFSFCHPDYSFAISVDERTDELECIACRGLGG